MVTNLRVKVGMAVIRFGAFVALGRGRSTTITHIPATKGA